MIAATQGPGEVDLPGSVEVAAVLRAARQRGPQGVVNDGRGRSSDQGGPGGNQT